MDMLGTRCLEEQDFGCGVHGGVLEIEQGFANLISYRRTPWFPRDHHRIPRLADGIRQWGDM